MTCRQLRSPGSSALHRYVLIVAHILLVPILSSSAFLVWFTTPPQAQDLVVSSPDRSLRLSQHIIRSSQVRATSLRQRLLSLHLALPPEFVCSHLQARLLLANLSQVGKRVDYFDDLAELLCAGLLKSRRPGWVVGIVKAAFCRLPLLPPVPE
jgi:hypothetical protein